MKSLFYFLSAAALLGLAAGEARAASADILTPNVRLGETLIVKFEETPARVAFDGDAIAPFSYRGSSRVIVPIPLSETPGAHKLLAEFTGGARIERTVHVWRKSQTIVLLPPPPKLGLTDKEISQNLAVANAGVRKVVQEIQNISYFQEPFSLPLTDNRNISSPFGEIRQTGEERITHLGTDFGAKKGRAVGAINGGVVKNAYTDPIYGNSVIVDHGRGIYSLYLHLHTIKVKIGDAVKKGTLVGTVGDSGLASAPHLHLSIKVNGISVDPLQFVRSFQ